MNDRLDVFVFTGFLFDSCFTYQNVDGRMTLSPYQKYCSHIMMIVDCESKAMRDGKPEKFRLGLDLNRTPPAQ